MTLGQHCYFPQQFTQWLFLKPWRILRIWWDILRPDVVLNIKNIRLFSGSKNPVGWRPTIGRETPSLPLLRRPPFLEHCRGRASGVGCEFMQLLRSFLDEWGGTKEHRKVVLGPDSMCLEVKKLSILRYQILALIPVMPPALRNESFNVTVWALSSWEETF